MQTPQLARITLVLLVALALAPPASAHTHAETADNRYTLVIGNLNEPVTTYTKTGLDLILSVHATGAPAIINAGDLTATLVAPDNTTLSQPLKAQFGKPGSYTFNDPYVLTQPGQYRLRLVGSINGSAVDGTYMVAGPVPSFSSTTFPDAAVPGNAELAREAASLRANLTALERDNAQMRDRIASLESGRHSAPAPALALLAVCLLGSALAARRR